MKFTTALLMAAGALAAPIVERQVTGSPPIGIPTFPTSPFPTPSGGFPSGVPPAPTGGFPSGAPPFPTGGFPGFPSGAPLPTGGFPSRSSGGSQPRPTRSRPSFAPAPTPVGPPA